MQGQQAALKQLTTMQELLSDTASKPLAMQQKVGTLAVQDLAGQLQVVLENLPTRQMMELKDEARAFGELLTSLVSPSLDMLKRAPVMPPGVELNEKTGAITATPTRPVTECVITVTASNGSGECPAVVTLSARAQSAPAGLSYASVMPAASEFANPPGSTGLLLMGDPVSMVPSFEHAGLPLASFSVEPALPAGLTLNAQTGEIHGRPSGAAARKDYTVSLANPSGSTEARISLEVQKHGIPGPLEYEPALSPDKQLHTIFVVGANIVAILPVTVDANNHLRFDVSPPLPQGLALDATTGAITGTPSIAVGKTTFTITARSMRGSTSAKIVFGIAGEWQITHPKEWSVEMFLVWLKDELKFTEDERAPFAGVDGKQMILLRSKEAVASKHASVPASFQVMMATQVNTLLSKWEAPQESTRLSRPVGVKAGDDAQVDYIPHELREKYLHDKVVGVGAYGVVISAWLVQKGHKQRKVAMKLVFAGQGSKGFSDTALRRLEREATLLGRIKHQHIVTLLSHDVSARNDVFWLIMEHLEGSSLDVVMQDPDVSFGEDSLIRLSLQILSALHALHEKNLVHRDVKPANIVKLSGIDVFKLIDLGVAAVVAMRDEEVAQSLITQGTVLSFAGTHGFMPPEAYRDRDKVGAHSDVWSFAATMFFIASRTMPFQAHDEFQWMFVIAGDLSAQAPKLNDVCPLISPRFSEIVAKGLHKQIDHRYSDAMEMHRDFGSLQTQGLQAIVVDAAAERKHWVEPGQGGFAAGDSNLFAVNPSSDEFAEVAARFLETMPHATIVSIERVQNAAMHEAFLLQASTLKKQLGADWDDAKHRKKLWHGTEAVEAIVNSQDGYGFLPLLAGLKTGAKWGDGTYAARDARYSDNYARTLQSGQMLHKQMLLVDVLLGQSVQGKEGMKMCPLLPGEKHKRYNSLYGFDPAVPRDPDDPTIFVIQHSNQAYPSYLLTYHGSLPLEAGWSCTQDHKCS